MRIETRLLEPSTAGEPLVEIVVTFPDGRRIVKTLSLAELSRETT